MEFAKKNNLRHAIIPKNNKIMILSEGSEQVVLLCQLLEVGPENFYLSPYLSNFHLIHTFHD